MGNSGKKSEKRKIGYHHLGMLSVALIVVLVLVILMIQCRSLEGTLAVYSARAAELEESIENERSRTQEIDELKEYMLTDEYAEQAAREHLGLVKENEIIFQEEK